MNARPTLWSVSTYDIGALSPLSLMNKCFVLPLVFGGSIILGLSSAQAAISSIEQVTVYQGLASVTRALPLTGNGEQTVVFSCLSPYLDKESLSVQSMDNVNIGEISIEELAGEQAAQCQYQGNAKAQQNTLASINAELEAARLAKAYLQNLTIVTQVNMDGTIANNASDIETQAAGLNQKILEIEQRRVSAQDALSQLIAGNSTSISNSVIQVSVRTASRSPSTLKLHYQVQGAGWGPTYQARLNTNNDQLNITASAIIAQQTGENWSNVPVTLSTANPNQRATGQLPYVPRLSLYEENKNNNMVNVPPMEESMPVVVVSGREEYGDAIAGSSLPSFAVSSQNKNGIIEYRLPQLVTIPSGGRRVRTVIGEQSGSSKLWVRSTPSVETVAYWYASAPFLTSDWVDGSLQLYRDGNYVGQSRYNYQMLKEQGIGFGRDPNIMVKEIINEDKQSEKGVLSRTQTLTTTKAYQFSNQHNRSVRLQVLGSEPISRDDSLKVSVTHTPPVTKQNWNDNQGVVAWEFDLPSKQSQVIRSTSQISYPANKLLDGNP